MEVIHKYQSEGYVYLGVAATLGFQGVPTRVQSAALHGRAAMEAQG